MDSSETFPCEYFWLVFPPAVEKTGIKFALTPVEMFAVVDRKYSENVWLICIGHLLPDMR